MSELRPSDVVTVEEAKEPFVTTAEEETVELLGEADAALELAISTRDPDDMLNALASLIDAVRAVNARLRKAGL